MNFSDVDLSILPLPNFNTNIINKLSTDILDSDVEKPEYIMNNLMDCYNRLVELTYGNTYDMSNWTLLIIKALKCVSSIKNIKAEEQVELGIEVIIYYLDNNTKIKDDELAFIRLLVNKLVWNIFENQGINKKNNKKTNKNIKKTQKRIDNNSSKIDIDTLVSPLQIINTLINKIEISVKTKGVNADNFILELPSILMNIVYLVDKYKHITKIEKKNLLIQTTKIIINDKAPEWFNLDESQKKSLNQLVNTLPNLIETIIGVVNDDLDFHIDFNNNIILKSISILQSLLFLFKCCKKNE